MDIEVEDFIYNKKHKYNTIVWYDFIYTFHFSTLIIISYAYEKYCSENVQLVLILLSSISSLSFLIKLFYSIVFEHMNLNIVHFVRRKIFGFFTIILAIILLCFFVRTNRNECNKITYFIGLCNLIYYFLCFSFEIFVCERKN